MNAVLLSDREHGDNVRVIDLRGCLCFMLEAGDLLFVPAHVEHRFERFSDDFRTWVIFFGPQGGVQA